MTRNYSPTQYTGFKAEKMACQFLIRKGLKLIASNYRNFLGEIDLIMEDKDTLVFIEVRYRQSSHYLKSVESISKQKQNRIIRTAHMYLQQYPTWKDNRLDVVAIQSVNNNYVIDWIKDAFQVE
jgi:putative endonuclease